MRAPRALLSISIAAIIAAVSGAAAATPEFPGKVEEDLGLSYTPPCTLCHQGTPGLGTATTAFATAMQARGLMQADDASLAAALKQMATDKIDSDGNGTLDVDQLKQGCDPSTDAALESGAKCGGGSGTDIAPSAAYGCGAQLAPGSTPWQGAVVLVAAVGAALARRRRRR